jgi:hypothetical protein
MPQSKILVDTNSYLRLALNIRPLLRVEFGPEPHCLYVLVETSNEISASSRLAHKFFWALEKEHCEERATSPTTSKQQKKDIESAFVFIWDFVLSDHPGPSKTDARYLAFGYVLEIPVITDDQDMRSLAEAFDIQTLSTLELLKKMVDVNHILPQKVSSIVAHWKYIEDIPANMKSDCLRLFPTLFGAVTPSS